MTSQEIAPTTTSTGSTPPEGAPPAAQTGPSLPDWTAGLNEDQKGYVANKGFKDPAATIDSYRNLEKLMGVPQDRLLKLPEKAEDADAWNSIYNRLGRPEKPDQYTLKAENADPNAVKWAQETFHKLGLTRKQAETLYAEFNGFAGQSAKSQQEAQETAAKLAADKQEADLKKEWGAEFDQRKNIAKAAAIKFGLDGEALDTIERSAGFAGVMKFLHNIGASIGEHEFVGSKQGAGGMDASGAKAKIRDLMTDVDFQNRLNAGGTTEKNEWNRLHVLAYSAE